MRISTALFASLAFVLGCGGDDTKTGTPLPDTATAVDTTGSDVATHDAEEPHDVDQPDHDGVEPHEVVEHDVPHVEDTPHPDDVPVPPEDVPLPPEDAGPPAPLPLFRVDTLAILSPDLCYTFPGGPSCTSLTATVNSILDVNLKDDADPTDVVFQFNGIVPAEGSTAVVLGAGVCTRDAAGEILSCKVTDEPMAPPVTFAESSLKQSGHCHEAPDVSAPCFVTPVKDGLVLSVAGLQIGMTSSMAAGRFHGANPKLEIVDGYIEGFLPKQTAATLVFDLPGAGVVALTDLLAKTPMETKGGLEGWTLEFSFTASQQPTP